MFRNQSSSENLLEQHQRTPLSEIDFYNNSSNYNNNAMQLLTRRVFVNLTKNALQTPTKLAVSSVAAIQKRNEEALRNYSSSANSKQNLLRFPAITLDETLPRFLKSVEPLLTDAELEETKTAVAHFNREEGAALQELLESVAKSEENWLATRWLKIAYMQYRDPVTVFSSPGMTFPLQSKFACESDYLTYAANVVYGLTRYKMMIDNGEIPTVKMGKLELDNSQFERVYGTNRIPKPREDCLEYNPKSQHVVVIYKNHFYKMAVYSCDCAPLHPEVLAGEMKKVLDAETCHGIPFGILSTDNRDNWAESYAELMKLDENRCSIEVIRKALFTVSLDEPVAMEPKEEWNQQSYQLIHGGGSKHNAGNRWMDKTIQVIVNRNGISGFTYEHSPAEGQPIALMVDYVVKNTKNKSFYECAVKDNFECIEKLRLKSSKCIDDLFLPAAIRNIDRLTSDLKMHVLNFTGYGKEYCKLQKLGPDSYIQMALQFAFYRLHREPAAHYESAHLRIYTGGRTETIRSCSNESIAFAKAMESGSEVSDVDRVKLLHAAVNGHQAYAKLALQGRGVDRHLLGLKLMALENKLPVPEFYKSPGFVKSTHFRLSTSQVASAYEAFMCYGPLVVNGYGACYNPRECNIIFALSSWNRDEETCATKFAKTLEGCLNEMRLLLDKHGEQPKAKL